MAANNGVDGWLKQIGEKLAELRMQKGYETIKDFAVHNELPEIHYWRIENGKSNVTLATLLKILAIHKVSLKDFFCDID